MTQPKPIQVGTRLRIGNVLFRVRKITKKDILLRPIGVFSEEDKPIEDGTPLATPLVEAEVE